MMSEIYLHRVLRVIVSPCYNGTSHSAADRAGVSQIGVMDEDGKIVDNAGISGKSSTGWRLWTTGGSS